jgi:hypothetical protein
MKIRTSPNEGPRHIGLKKKVIEMLKRRYDVIGIYTELPIRTRQRKHLMHADVCAEKAKGTIYAEVKTSSDFFSGITQLREMDDGNSNNEFILVCNFNDMLTTRKILRTRMEDLRRFINKAQLYNFDEKLNLIYREIYISRNGEIWVDGKRMR